MLFSIHYVNLDGFFIFLDITICTTLRNSHAKWAVGNTPTVAYLRLPEATILQPQFFSIGTNKLHFCRAAAVVGEHLVGVAAEEAEQAQLVVGGGALQLCVCVCVCMCACDYNVC